MSLLQRLPLPSSLAGRDCSYVCDISANGSIYILISSCFWASLVLRRLQEEMRRERHFVERYSLDPITNHPLAPPYFAALSSIFD